MNQRQKVAVVTGGGTGIGLACAEALQSRGWRVLCTGLDADPDFPTTLEFRKVDVSSAADITELFADLPYVDGLINAAGIILHEQREFTPEGFEKVLAINLGAVNRVTLAALPALKAAHGAVVNVASMWSQFGSARNPAYSASKGGVASLTRSHAVAFAGDGVRVNAIAPGWIDTRLASGAIHNPERSAAILGRIPMGRWGQPEDVARVVSFLLSSDADYVTGIVMPVDGGFGIA